MNPRNCTRIKKLQSVSKSDAQELLVLDACLRDISLCETALVHGEAVNLLTRRL